MNLNELKKIRLSKGRKQTDKSLGVERASADEFFLNINTQTKHKTDEAFSKIRADADESKRQSRSEFDASKGIERASSGGIRLSEQNYLDEQLRFERETADELLGTERRHVDSIFSAERRQNELIESGRFEAERKKTDADLTKERKRADIEVQRAGVEATTRDEFLSIVSHDLRNPLGSISMAAQMIASKPFISTDDTEVREFVNIIERNAGQAMRLISDLIDHCNVSRKVAVHQHKR